MDTPVMTVQEFLAQLPDPRAARGQRHPWAAWLLVVVAGLVSGQNGPAALARWVRDAPRAWLRELGLTRRRGPSATTLQRVLRQVDVARLEALVGPWLQQHRAAARPVGPHWLDGIAIDAKTVRGARRLGAADTHLLSAYGHQERVVLGQVAVPDGTTALSVVEPLLAALPLEGETVTCDAEFTQYPVAVQVVRQGGAYLMVVKGNQPTLRADCVAATARPARRLGETHTVHLGHGRIEERTLVVADAQDVAWPHAPQALRLHRRRIGKATGEVLSDETTSAVTSLRPEQADPAALLRLWQGHWGIENRLHWVRDVVFGEDQATTRKAHAPQALAIFRNLAISLLHQWRGPGITAARAFYALHPTALFHRLSLAARQL